MNIKKNILLMFCGLSLIYVLPTAAMLSKPEHTEEDKEYTKEVENINNQLLQECRKPYPNAETIMSLIFDHNVDLNARDELGNTPLIIECKKTNNDDRIIMALITFGLDVSADVNAQNYLGMTPLHYACQNNRRDIVELLIKNGANINAQDKTWYTPLHLACRHGYIEIVKILIANGAHINAQDKIMYTPLHIACKYEYIETVKFLIAKGADINAKNFVGTTPLHFACGKGNIDLVNFLLKNGADINAQTENGRTPLHDAVDNDNIQLCRELLKWNPNTDLTTEDGMSALDFAYDKGYTNIVALFKELGIQTPAEKQTNANMITFFKELNQEEIKKSTKRKKKRRKPQPTQDITIELTPAIDPHVPSTPEVTPLITAPSTPIPTPGINIPATTPVMKKPAPATKSVPVAVVQPQKKSSPPTTPVMRDSSPAIKNSQVIPTTPSSLNPNNGYQILIGENLKWPTSLNENQKTLMKQHLLSLKNWPHHTNLDIKKLKNEQNMFRLRFGNYRILFSVNTQRREIKIHKIGLRKKVYQDR
jgi:ankyrin repeat protein/mRNA-degrading endonuclease RelE of RelBE toxin-antitoxin system